MPNSFQEKYTKPALSKTRSAFANYTTLGQGYSTSVSKGPDLADEKSFGPEKVLTVL